ncbi:MAG: AmpG family muropeptide MFS transporter [Alphaproteobacteria bacterium]
MAIFAGTLGALKSYAHPRVAAMLVLGASCGLPLLTITGTLALWLTDNQVSLTDIGLFAYAALPYALKMVWAPVLDQVRLPVLHRLLGRRRSWILVAQLGAFLALLGLSFSNPSENLALVAFFSLLLGFAGANQDISVDAWRIEVAPKEEQGAMVAAYQLGYRLSVFATGVFALYLAQFFSWRIGLFFLATLMLLGIGATLFARRTEERYAIAETGGVAKKLSSVGKIAAALTWFYGAVIAPFVDFFNRHAWTGLLVLALIGSYRLPDFVMGTMAGPLYRKALEFTLVEIGTIVKFIGVWVTIAGAFIGGLFVARFGVMRPLFIGLIAVMIGNLSYAWLATRGHDTAALSIAIGIENLASGFAGTVLIAYMSSLTSTAFTATQYALFSSFYALPGKLLGGLSGVFVEWLAAHRSFFDALFPFLAALPDKVVGFVPFFVFTAMAGIPALILLIIVYRLEGEPTAVGAKVR